MKERQFTEHDLMGVIEEALIPRYYRYGRLQSVIEYEDLCQECVMGWLEPMWEYQVNGITMSRLEMFYTEYVPSYSDYKKSLQGTEVQPLSYRDYMSSIFSLGVRAQNLNIGDIVYVLGDDVPMFIETVEKRRVQRLDYYSRKCTYEHVHNMVRMSAFQTIHNFVGKGVLIDEDYISDERTDVDGCTVKSYMGDYQGMGKGKTFRESLLTDSFQRQLSSGEDSGRILLDVIPDDKAIIDEFLVYKDIISGCTPEQINVIEGLMHGYTKTSLREKYNYFDKELKNVQDKIIKYYESSGESLSFTR